MSHRAGLSGCTQVLKHDTEPCDQPGDFRKRSNPARAFTQRSLVRRKQPAAGSTGLKLCPVRKTPRNEEGERTGEQTDPILEMIWPLADCSVLLLLLLFLSLLKNVWAQDEASTMPSISTTPGTGPNIVAIVVPTVVLGVLAILTAVLVFLFCVVKKKRQTEGTYRPSAEEQTGTRGVEAPDALKLPKEERLI
ncbi:hypothetical protein DNTS_021777 [Danionella cerebrum]|uniref:Uncharacterized protein n=1 Tax=Danionella cerebrum TaxID=2873325 RepID=A0A553RKA0_9TELE|nr:hypothetical protein DNTS_021777 [Danionella translucida]